MRKIKLIAAILAAIAKPMIGLKLIDEVWEDLLNLSFTKSSILLLSLLALSPPKNSLIARLEFKIFL